LLFSQSRNLSSLRLAFSLQQRNYVFAKSDRKKPVFYSLDAGALNTIKVAMLCLNIAWSAANSFTRKFNFVKPEFVFAVFVCQVCQVCQVLTAPLV
jgi:hypothetical protein